MLKETALVNEHRLLGAKFINFQGWKLPLEFSGSVAEHLNVRKNSGLFDVSHMGEIRVRGKGALKFLETYLTNNVSILKENQTQYNFLCNKGGGIIDDLILYCFQKGEDYLLCVNSARLEADLTWLRQSNFPGEICNESDQWAQLALQGPDAPALLTDVLTSDFNHISEKPYSVKEIHSLENQTTRQRELSREKHNSLVGDSGKTLRDMKKNHFQWFSFFGEPVLISTTGYTGEKGFEFLVSSKNADSLWRAILKRGKPRGCLPTGLAARDTLRMEMKYPLYGKDVNENIDPHSAGFSWAVRNSTNFIGSSALLQIQKKLQKKWVGFQLLPEEEFVGVPRPGSRILVRKIPVGEVTSGAKSPSLCKMIGLGYVPIEYSRPGQKVQVEIHQNTVPAEIVSTPFIKKG